MLERQPIMVAIVGGSCSGKTTLTKSLLKHYGEVALVVHFDDYFRGKAHLPEGFVDDWENPYVFDMEQYVHDVTQLSRGESAFLPIKKGEHSAENAIPTEVLPRPIIFLEGFLVMHPPAVRRLFTSSFFIEVPTELMLQRRLLRAQEPGNWDTEEYIRTKLLPGYEQYVVPQKQYCDEMIDGTQSIEYQRDLVVRRIGQKKSRGGNSRQ